MPDGATGGRNPQVEGFYAGYFTGAGGNGLGMFVLDKGKIAGVDAAGTTFDGTYDVKDEQHGLAARLSVTAPAGISLIQGVSSGPAGTHYDMDFSVPLDDVDAFFRVETPLGPVNGRLVKLRDLA